MSSVTISAPGKQMLLGDHAVVHHHPCLVAAIDRRITLTASHIDEPILELNAPDLDLVGYRKPLRGLTSGKVPKAAEYIEYALAQFINTYPISGGVRVDTNASDIGSKFGFGTSSAATVAAVKAMANLFNHKLDNQAIFAMAYQAVIALKGVGSGFDIAAATYGGVLYYVTGGTTIEPLKIAPFNLIVAYSGHKADTPTLVRAMASRREQYSDIINGLFDVSEHIVEHGRKDFETGDLVSLGQMFSMHQGLLQALGVSTPELDEICHLAMRAGAYGAKLSGAGGGDCAIAIAPPDKTRAVLHTLSRGGYEATTITAGSDGVRVE